MKERIKFQNKMIIEDKHLSEYQPVQSVASPSTPRSRNDSINASRRRPSNGSNSNSVMQNTRRHHSNPNIKKNIEMLSLKECPFYDVKEVEPSCPAKNLKDQLQATEKVRQEVIQTLRKENLNLVQHVEELEQKLESFKHEMYQDSRKEEEEHRKKEKEWEEKWIELERKKEKEVKTWEEKWKFGQENIRMFIIELEEIKKLYKQCQSQLQIQEEEFKNQTLKQSQLLKEKENLEKELKKHQEKENENEKQRKHIQEFQQLCIQQKKKYQEENKEINAKENILHLQSQINKWIKEKKKENEEIYSSSLIMIPFNFFPSSSSSSLSSFTEEEKEEKEAFILSCNHVECLNVILIDFCHQIINFMVNQKGQQTVLKKGYQNICLDWENKYIAMKEMMLYRIDALKNNLNNHQQMLIDNEIEWKERMKDLLNYLQNRQKIKKKNLNDGHIQSSTSSKNAYIIYTHILSLLKGKDKKYIQEDDTIKHSLLPSSHFSTSFIGLIILEIEKQIQDMKWQIKVKKKKDLNYVITCIEYEKHLHLMYILTQEEFQSLLTKSSTPFLAEHDQEQDIEVVREQEKKQLEEILCNCLLIQQYGKEKEYQIRFINYEWNYKVFFNIEKSMLYGYKNVSLTFQQNLQRELFCIISFQSQSKEDQSNEEKINTLKQEHYYHLQLYLQKKSFQNLFSTAFELEPNLWNCPKELATIIFLHLTCYDDELILLNHPLNSIYETNEILAVLNEFGGLKITFKQNKDKNMEFSSTQLKYIVQQSNNKVSLLYDITSITQLILSLTSSQLNQFIHLQ